MTVDDDHTDDVELNRCYWDEEAAAAHGPLARGQPAATAPRWGLWATPEPQVSMFPRTWPGWTQSS